MLKTNQFQVTSKETLYAFASKYDLGISTSKEDGETLYSLHSSKNLDCDTDKLCQELQKLLSNKQPVFLSIGDSIIAITPDNIVRQPKSDFVKAMMKDISNL